MTHKSQNVEVAETPNNRFKPGVNFNKNEFERIIWQKGYDVVHEKSLRCPCVGRGTNQQSNCKNCGGTGWIFINPIETKAILHSMNLNTEYKEWSEEAMGTVNVSMRDSDKIAFMDRLTVSEAEVYYSEVIHINKDEASGDLFAYLSYNIKSIEYAGVFVSVNDPLNRLTEDDYTFDHNKFFLDSSFQTAFDNADGDYSLVLRYKHAPQFYIVDLTRETMVTNIIEGTKQNKVLMPVSAIGRRGHYVLDSENLSNNRILDNSFDEKDC